jgi:glycosyltransferase involved in cell wall biosynthesis
LRVVHVSFSSLGGAGSVAEDLCAEQVSMGIDSRSFFLTSNGLLSLWNRHPGLVARGILDYTVIRKDRKLPLFTLFRGGGIGCLESIPTGPDVVVHIHWLPGILELAALPLLQRNVGGVVWTLHDMWPVTGGCHHSLSCTSYVDSCEGCPQVRSVFRTQVSKALGSKREIYREVSGLRVVAPSNWIQKIAIDSGVFGTHRVDLIRNPVDKAFFLRRKDAGGGVQPGGSSNPFVFGISASSLGDPIKGVNRALRLLEEVGSITLDRTVVVLLIGAKAPRTSCRNVQVMSTGYLQTARDVAETLSGVDVFVSLSEADTAPIAVAEAMSMGIPILCNNVGGLTEFCDNGKNGIAVNSDAEFIDAAIHMMTNGLKTAHMSKNCSKFASQNFDRRSVAEKYLDVYKQAIKI